MSTRYQKRKRREDSHAAARPPRRVATVYDAVAGRVGYEQFLSATELESTTKSSRPDEVLYRRLHAPQRYEEDDEYYKHAHVTKEHPLPDSGLLETLHAYTSDYYSAATATRGSLDWKSMDETALLALGILLEETMASSLGETGDLAFVEGEQTNLGPDARGFWNGNAWVQSAIHKRPKPAMAHQDRGDIPDSDGPKPAPDDDDLDDTSSNA